MKEKADAEAKAAQEKYVTEQAEKELAERLALKKELEPDYAILANYAKALDLTEVMNFGAIKHPIAVAFSNEVESDVYAIIHKIKQFLGE